MTWWLTTPRYLVTWWLRRLVLQPVVTRILVAMTYVLFIKMVILVMLVVPPM